MLDTILSRLFHRKRLGVRKIGGIPTRRSSTSERRSNKQSSVEPQRLAECVDGLPNLSGEEALIAETIADASARAVFAAPASGDPSAGIQSAFAIALHMHHPLIPAGGNALRAAALISNLRYMTEHPDIGDNHNASVFRW